MFVFFFLNTFLYMDNSRVMNVHLNEVRVAPSHVSATYLQISICSSELDLSSNISILVSVKLCPKIHTESQ